ncbi:hypothetical protein PISMIDRAFT_275970 [Pisolithus microcarpus 441]|uniref:Uncharacterized protein n=1 Tax=Pisolithus microcarpus 441 TaxID=765257 RepID=A0A0C9YQT1_9AGAM|nr:hypothetical protein PISMIDRAFT_275970 [Pisolithus microcarpus 441]
MRSTEGVRKIVEDTHAGLSHRFSSHGIQLTIIGLGMLSGRLSFSSKAIPPFLAIRCAKSTVRPCIHTLLTSRSNILINNTAPYALLAHIFLQERN